MRHRAHPTRGRASPWAVGNRVSLIDAEGKFVLIKGEELAGVYDSQEDAIREGYRQFGNVPFLVKKVLKIETPQRFVSGMLAV